MLFVIPPALVLLISAMVSSLLLWALIPQLRSCMLDQPNARSSHRRPTPRAGGLAFVLVAALSSALVLFRGLPGDAAFSGLVMSALPLAVVGFFDDRHSLGSAVRFGVQLATALLLLLLSPLAMALPAALWAVAPLGWLLSLPALLLLVIAITAVINFTNFMDGLDGLVAGCMAVSSAALATALDAPWSLWALVGALLGFIFWNWSPAKVLMGDVGSTFLGAVFAGLALQASSWTEAIGYLLVVTPLLGDACICVPRRLLAGQHVFQAHRLHLFQRLHQAGWSHSRVSLTYIAATTVLAVAMLAGGWPWVLGLAVVEMLLGLWLDRSVAVPFAVASKN